MKHLNIEQKGSIAIVSIARPDAMNALNQEVLREFFSLQEHFRKDLDTRVVIFTGEGDHFSAGADLKEKAQLSTKLESWRNNYGKPAIKSILDIDQITIAAVNGYCLGGAACIASACDFRIASTNSILGYPEINLGINLNDIRINSTHNSQFNNQINLGFTYSTQKRESIINKEEKKYVKLTLDNLFIEESPNIPKFNFGNNFG